VLDARLTDRLRDLNSSFADVAPELAIFLVHDRPSRLAERPGLARAYFAERCVSDIEITATLEALREVGAYVELIEGELPLVKALGEGRLQAVDRRLKMVYNGIEGGVGVDAFRPGRKALVPVLADAYGIICSNSSAFSCAIGRHKFHYLTLLRSIGLPTPRAWHYRGGGNWAGDLRPDRGTKVIAKSTYESWSVGVTDDSVFEVDASCSDRVEAVFQMIGQAVTVQEFVSGPEVCVPVVTTPVPLTTVPVESILARAPRNPDAVATIDDNLTQSGITYVAYDGPKHIIEKMVHYAVSAFELLELSGLARIDFRIDKDGQPWIIDLGVSPSLAADGSARTSFAELDLSYDEFLRSVMAVTLVAAGVI
jgi:D-alanine-D-alanine ligase